MKTNYGVVLVFLSLLLWILGGDIIFLSTYIILCVFWIIGLGVSKKIDTFRWYYLTNFIYVGYWLFLFCIVLSISFFNIDE